MTVIARLLRPVRDVARDPSLHLMAAAVVYFALWAFLAGHGHDHRSDLGE